MRVHSHPHARVRPGLTDPCGSMCELMVLSAYVWEHAVCTHTLTHTQAHTSSLWQTCIYVQMCAHSHLYTSYIAECISVWAAGPEKRFSGWHQRTQLFAKLMQVPSLEPKDAPRQELSSQQQARLRHRGQRNGAKT